EEGRAGRLDAAEAGLQEALTACGSRGAVLRELAGVHFLRHDYRAAVETAEAATEEDAADAHSWEVLAASRYLEGDKAGALRAWRPEAEPWGGTSPPGPPTGSSRAPRSGGPSARTSR